MTTLELIMIGLLGIVIISIIIWSIKDTIKNYKEANNKRDDNLWKLDNKMTVLGIEIDKVETIANGNNSQIKDLYERIKKSNEEIVNSQVLIGERIKEIEDKFKEFDEQVNNDLKQIANMTKLLKDNKLNKHTMEQVIPLMIYEKDGNGYIKNKKENAPGVQFTDGTHCVEVNDIRPVLEDSKPFVEILWNVNDTETKGLLTKVEVLENFTRFIVKGTRTVNL